MSNATKKRRLRALGVILTLATTVASVGATARSAQAQGVTPEALAAAGWDCFQTPPPIVPPRIVCANPGLGGPSPGNPTPPPAYTLKTFDLGGTYDGISVVRII